MTTLNPCTKLCELNTGVGEVNTNEEVQREDIRIIKIVVENEYEWKILSKCVNKKNINTSWIVILLCGKNNNLHIILNDYEYVFINTINDDVVMA